MEVSCCSALQLQRNNSLLLFESVLEKSSACDPAPDTGYFSSGSSLSPTSSVDSFCFSPSSIQAAEGDLDTLSCFMFSRPPAPHFGCSRSCTTSATKKSRSRYPGKKRQTASEREKLRMRDLTKALHHLRTYLPTSVAPAGQTLTKIETLRLTIRYISYLSAQLGLSQEVLEQRRTCGYMDQPQSLRQILDQLQESDCSRVELTCVQPSHQVGSEQYWIQQQQQIQNATFSGRR